MKKIIRLCTLFAVSCLLAGCDSDENMGSLGNPVAVQFGLGEIYNLRTTSGGDQWALSDRVGIFMIENGQALSSTNIAEGADNRLYQAQTGNSNESGFDPVGTDAIYYPQDGSRVDFIAYYPYKASLPNYTYPVDVSNQASPAGLDVLYANTNPTLDNNGYNKNSGVVDLQFNHALSKLSFTLTSVDGSPSLTGAKIEITNLATTANINLANGTVTATDNGQTLTANTASDGLSSSAIVIPQTLSGTKLIITLADDISIFEWTFTPTEFEKNKNHQYEITVSKTGIIVNQNGITNWTETDEVEISSSVEQIKYKIDDYYPIPSDAKSAIGVVFWLDPNDPGYDDGLPDGFATGFSGKIVSLDQENSVRWGEEVNEYEDGVTGIRDATSGRLGTVNLITKRRGQSNFRNEYSAFNWIYLKNDEDVNGIWYMPSIDELSSLSQNRTIINSKMSNANGIEIETSNPNSSYLSSTEISTEECYSFSMYNVNVIQNYKFTASTLTYVRAIAIFIDGVLMGS